MSSGFASERPRRGEKDERTQRSLRHADEPGEVRQPPAAAESVWRESVWRQQLRRNPYGSYGGNSYGGAAARQSVWSAGRLRPFSDFFGGFGYGSYGGYQTQVNPPQEQAGDSEPVRAAIRDILAGRYTSACSILQNVPSTGRNARWYYLSGVANHGAGNQIQALEHMKRAVQLSPNNATYQALLRQYQQAGQTYQTNASGYNTWAMDPSKLCMSLCFLQMFCPLCCRC